MKIFWKNHWAAEGKNLVWSQRMATSFPPWWRLAHMSLPTESVGWCIRSLLAANHDPLLLLAILVCSAFVHSLVQCLSLLVFVRCLQSSFVRSFAGLSSLSSFVRCLLSLFISSFVCLVLVVVCSFGRSFGACGHLLVRSFVRCVSSSLAHLFVASIVLARSFVSSSFGFACCHFCLFICWHRRSLLLACNHSSFVAIVVRL